MRILQRHFPTVKWLVTNPPTRGTLGLQSSEVHLEFDKERQACLKSLSFDNLRYHNIANSHEHTLGWFLECDEYNAWISSEHSCMLFIEGKPGSGKSTLMRFFRDKFVSNLGSESDILADFFYSARDGELHRSHDSMLITLLHDILKADATFFVHFQKDFRDLTRGSEGVVKWPYKTLKDVLLACSKHQARVKLVLIVDAMDESEDTERQDIVTLLWGLASSTAGACVKVLLASRPINERPVGFDSGCQRILLQEKNKKDIGNYTRAFLGDLSFGLDQEIIAEAKEYIIAHADGVFVWVHLIEKELKNFLQKGPNATELMKHLQSLPRDLEKYYEFMLQGMESNKQSEVEQGKRILQFCLFSHRPIGLLELHHALAVPLAEHQHSTNFKKKLSIDIRGLLTHCVGHFLEIKTIPGYEGGWEFVQVMHQTVREFFLRPQVSVKFYTTANEAGTMIRLTCARYLLICLEEIRRISDLPVRPKDWNQHAFVLACRYLDKRMFFEYSLEYL
ncbi:hypothetical protein FN846DRAFT_785447, partial [Sphaerosporella brunnea]